MVELGLWISNNIVPSFTSELQVPGIGNNTQGRFDKDINLWEIIYRVQYSGDNDTENLPNNEESFLVDEDERSISKDTLTNSWHAKARINLEDKDAEKIVKTICILPVLAEPIVAGTDCEVQKNTVDP